MELVKSSVDGNPVSLPEMDNVAKGLANGNDLLYYRVR